MGKTDYTSDIVAFFRDLYPLDTGAPVIPIFLAEWLYTAFPPPEGHPAARNILDSRSKKQGKSATGGLVALYMASRRRGSEVVISAADLDQSKDRVFKSVKFAVENSPIWRKCKVYKTVVELDNGSIIQAIPYDWRGASGGNYSAVIFDELHTYTQEGQRRQFDELIIPPTQPEGVRWIASYAGFLGESILLKEIWDRALSGERLEGELPIWRNQAAGLLALIDQGEESWRMPWTTPGFMAEVAASERPSTYRRLWLNEWVSAESEFITPEQWQACESAEVRPLTVGDRGRRVVFGADASTSRDLTALVGVEMVGDLADVVYCHVWRPVRGLLRLGKPTVDLSATIGAEIQRLHNLGQVQSVYYDPYQLHSIALDLEKAGVSMVELPQTAARTSADQALFDAIVGHSLRHYGEPTLTEHITNAVAIETARGFRLAKEKTSRKIDAAVALSMANYGAINSKGWGVVEYIPDPFSDANWPPPEGDVVWSWERGWITPNKYRKHSKGATGWEDCKHRMPHGCDECERELAESGYFEQRAAAERLMMETYNPAEVEADLERLRHPWAPPISDEEALANLVAHNVIREIKKQRS